MQFFFSYGPWHALLKKVEPGEHGGAENYYVGPILHKEKSVGRFRYGLTNKIKKYPREVFVEAFKTHAEEQLGTRIPTRDDERFDFLSRVVRDFCLYRLEGGTIAGWLGRHGLEPTTRLWPIPGPEEPLLMKLGSKWYVLPPSKFLWENEEPLCKESAAL